MATGNRVGYYAYMTVEGSDSMTPIESIYEREEAALYLLKYLRCKDRVVPKRAQMKYEQLVDRFFREHVNLVEQGKRRSLRLNCLQDVNFFLKLLESAKEQYGFYCDCDGLN